MVDSIKYLIVIFIIINCVKCSPIVFIDNESKLQNPMIIEDAFFKKNCKKYYRNKEVYIDDFKSNDSISVYLYNITGKNTLSIKTIDYRNPYDIMIVVDNEIIRMGKNEKGKKFNKKAKKMLYDLVGDKNIYENILEYGYLWL